MRLSCLRAIRYTDRTRIREFVIGRRFSRDYKNLVASVLFIRVCSLIQCFIDRLEIVIWSAPIKRIAENVIVEERCTAAIHEWACLEIIKST